MDKQFWVEGVRPNLAGERIGSCCLARGTKLWRRARMPRQLELVFFNNFGTNRCDSYINFRSPFLFCSARENQTIVSVLLPVPCAACATSVALEIRCALPATRVRVMPAAAAEHSLHIHRLMYNIVVVEIWHRSDYYTPLSSADSSCWSPLMCTCTTVASSLLAVLCCIHEAASLFFFDS